MPSMTTCATCYTGPCDDSLPSSKKRQAQACEGRAGGETEDSGHDRAQRGQNPGITQNRAVARF